MMEAEVAWAVPHHLAVPEDCRSGAVESVEADLQEQRERRQVSAVYFSAEHVPPSPAEDRIEPGQNLGLTRAIPESTAGQPVQRVLVGSPKSPPLDAQMLSALLARVPTPPTALAPPPPLPFGAFPRPPMPPFPLPSQMARPPPPPFPLPTQMARPPLPPGFPFPPPPLPGAAPSAAFPFALPPLPGRPPAFPFAAPVTQVGARFDPSKVKTKPCKYWVPGQGGSCRFGDACNFIHQQ
jgi:hypothetical protein